MGSGDNEGDNMFHDVLVCLLMFLATNRSVDIDGRGGQKAG
jgi:hypothetical protein